MKDADRMTPAARAARLVSWGLLCCAAFAGASAALDRETRPDSQSIAEPTENPDGRPALLERKPAARTPEGVIRKWPQASRVETLAMIDKYGPPARSTRSSLVWVDKGPWRKIVVHRRGWPYLFGGGRQLVLEQAIAYRVPVDKEDDLRRFDPRLEVDSGRGLLSSRSASEGENRLALNLADEIVTGKRTVEEARDFAAKTKRLAQAGKSSPYMERLLFSGRRGRRPAP